MKKNRLPLLLLGLLAAAGALLGAASPAAADTGAAVVRHGAAVSDANALVAEVRVSLNRAARVFVEYDNPQAGRYRTALSAPGAAHLIPIVRLRPETTYDYTIFVAAGHAAEDAGSRDAAAGPGGSFITGALPPPLADLSVRATGRSSQPLILADYYRPGESGTEYFVFQDETGAVVWYAHEAGSPIDRLPGGNWIFVNEGRLTEMTSLGEVVNRFEPRGQWGVPHHDVTVLDDSRVIYPSRKFIVFDDSVNGGATQTRFRVDHLRVWDRESGRVKQVWDAMEAWDILDPNQMAPGIARQHDRAAVSWVHLNSVSSGPLGNFILSFRHRNQVISLSPDFRTIEWQLNGPDSDYEFPNPADRFYAQHTAAQLANGNVLIFDNGNDRPEAEGGEYSRALELRLDAAAGTAVKVWEYRPDPDIYSSGLGSAYRLRNGNTLVRFPRRRLTDRPLLTAEVDAAGNEVFRLEPLLAGYRAYGGITAIMGETMLRPPVLSGA